MHQQSDIHLKPLNIPVLSALTSKHGQTKLSDCNKLANWRTPFSILWCDKTAR